MTLHILASGFIVAFSTVAVPAAQNVQLTWDASPSAGIVGYTVYYGSESGSYENVIEITNSLEVVVSNLVDGLTYYFALSARDSSGAESDLSAEVAYSVPGIAPPGPVFSIDSVPADQAIQLQWTPSRSPNVDYIVYYGVEPTNYLWSTYASGTSDATVYGVQAGLTYYLAVSAYDPFTGQESALGPEIAYTVPTVEPPGAVTSFQPRPDGGLLLQWDPSPDATVMGYNVYVRGDTDPSYWYSTSAVGTNQATVYGLGDGVQYSFVVKAFDSAWQESGPGPAASYFVPFPEPPGRIISVNQNADGVVLKWEPSPSAAVVGYYVYFGPDSGYYSGAYSAYGTNEVLFSNLPEGQTYYFSVLAYDATGQLSVPSDEVSYTVVALPPTLDLQHPAVDGLNNVYSVTATGTLPASWTLEASSDLRDWRTVATGTDASMNVTVVVAENPSLFFRLNSWYDGITLETNSVGANGFVGAFCVTTAYAVPWDWTVEFSDDLTNWNTLVSGAYEPVNVAVIPGSHPRMFFRLESNAP